MHIKLREEIVSVNTERFTKVQTILMCRKDNKHQQRETFSNSIRDTRGIWVAIQL